MNDELKARFEALGTFPSPPRIAQEILALARNPDASITDLCGVLSKDPALATKVLRMANSPLYARRRRSQNLRQALTVIGLEATLTLCLGFSIVGSFRGSKTGSVDYNCYWRRSLLTGLASRCIGEEAGVPGSEDLFLAGLLEGIGILALDQAIAGFYSDLRPDASHLETIAYERERLADDHAAIGAWLLRRWNMPSELCHAVERSHAPERTDLDTDAGRFGRCVGLGSDLVSAILAIDVGARLSSFHDRAFYLLGLDVEQVGRIQERLTELTPDLGRLFDTTLLSADDALALTAHAQELLAGRSVILLQEVAALAQTNQTLVVQSEAFEDASRRDGLTGLFNRRYLDDRLAAEFAAANVSGWTLAALFIDIDHFKRINDTLGHHAGDGVLRATARLMRDVLRVDDILGRYGGEEFVILLPGASRTDARELGERLLDTLRQYRHHCDDVDVVATASAGLAVHTPSAPFADGGSLVAAAGQAMSAAKRAGRNRLAERHADPDAVQIEVAGSAAREAPSR